MKEIKLDVLKCFGKLRDVKGIDYKKRTSSRIHFVPGMNVYVGKCFHIGNLKISRNVAIFSLMELFTCLDCADCAKDCYAVKASTAYPTCNNFRWLMTFLAINYENLSDENMTELNAKEFKALILLLKSTEKDFAEYLEKCCVLYHGKIENLFN